MSRPVLVKSGIAVMVVPILCAVVPTVLSMVQTFQQAAMEEGVDAQHLSDAIGVSLTWTLVMLPLTVFGLILVIIGIFAKSKPEFIQSGDDLRV